jgi:DNA-binding MarR family transcriptional regulator
LSPPPATAWHSDKLRGMSAKSTTLIWRWWACTTQYSTLAKLKRLGPLSINELANSMVMDRTTLGRTIRPLERDKLLAIGAGDDGRTRSLCLTATGAARLKTATEKWREAQQEFETAFGAHDAAKPRTVLRRAISATSESAVQ